MTNRKRLTREEIVHTLVDALKPLDYVHAFWEGGAAAFNRIDEWSDIDLYLAVSDGKVDDTFADVEQALTTLSPIVMKLEVPQLPWPGVSQAFYKMKGASEFLLIDLAVIKMSSPEKFLEPEIHGKNVFYFNKHSEVKIPRLDKALLNRKLRDKLNRLKARFSMFNIFVQKEINRKNHLEAIDLYHNFTLGALVEALRIKHNPVHHDFKTRYVYYELPSDVLPKLERLYFVKNGEDLQNKYDLATKWFHEIVSTLNEETVEKRIMQEDSSDRI